MSKSGLLHQIGLAGAVIALSGLALSALLVLPLFDQPLQQTKILVLFVLTLLVLVSFMAKSWAQSFITFVISPLTLPLFLFGSAIVASSFFTSNYPVSNLLGMGGVLIASSIFALFAPNIISQEKSAQWLQPTILIIGSLLTFSLGLQMLGVGPSHLLNLAFPIAFPTNELFNLTGSSLIAAQILFILLVGSVSAFFTSKKSSLINQLSIMVLVGGLGLHVWTLLPGKAAEPILLDYATSWSIAADTLKTPKTALIGFGPEGFKNAFNLYKPREINQTKVWNIQFSQASNMPLSILVSTGLVGFSAWLFMVWTIVKQTKEVTQLAKPVHAMVLAGLAIQLLFPLTVVLATFQAIFIALWIVLEGNRFAELEIYGLTFRTIKNKAVPHPLTNHTQTILVLFLLTIGTAVVLGTYGVGRAFLAHYYALEGLRAAQKNDAAGVYNSQRTAALLNPYLDDLRRQYAISNLTIARALAQKENPTEEEKQQIGQLIQQSIREGQAATLIDPLNTTNWLSLAQTYRALIGTVEAADQWTVGSYVNAVQTDPQNPITRTELGGILYGAQNYNQAAQFFQQALASKPDYANGYYNLANTFVKLQQYQAAKEAYQQTLQLIAADSPDAVQATKELAEVDKVLAEMAKANEAAAATKAAYQQPATTLSGVVESPLTAVSQPASEQLSL